LQSIDETATFVVIIRNMMIFNSRDGAFDGINRRVPERSKRMSIRNLKEKYKTPLAQVGVVFLSEGMAIGVQSPVKRVTLEDWEAGAAQPVGDGDFSLPLW
jgi:hypothetical protein